LGEDFGPVEARGIPITFAITQESLVSLVDASRQQVTQYFDEFDREKIILREGRRIIVDPKSLDKIDASRT